MRREREKGEIARREKCTQRERERVKVKRRETDKFKNDEALIENSNTNRESA